MSGSNSKSKARSVSRVVQATDAMEGQGARVKRSIGTRSVRMVSPFLMLDEFHVTPPAGFPDHPHRGFETVTYMLGGAFRHKDNKGHEGVITEHGVQWMTAGRGIVHSEMPETKGDNFGLQLWVNLKSTDKMTDPNYQEKDAADIPHKTIDGVTVRTVAGKSNDEFALAADVYTATPTMYHFIEMEPGKSYTQPIPEDWNAFVYIVDGDAVIGADNAKAGASHIVVAGAGAELTIRSTGDATLRFLLCAGEPIDEPVAQRGPIVMNTEAELNQAFEDYWNGRF